MALLLTDDKKGKHVLLFGLIRAYLVLGFRLILDVNPYYHRKHSIVILQV